MTPPRAALDVLAGPLDGTRLIEASAGTGKTWHLCALVLRLLLERGLALPQVLVVTFTNAATAELRERVRARLREAAACLEGRGAVDGSDPFVPALLARLREEQGLDEAVLAQRVALALQAFDEAAIFTLHGFCQRALAELPLAAGQPLASTLLADDRALVEHVVQAFWRRHVAGEDGTAVDPALAAHLAARGDTPRQWAQLLARRLHLPLSPCLWPADLDAPQAHGVPPLAVLEELYRAAQQCWRLEREAIRDALHAARPGLHAGLYRPEAMAQALAHWDRWLQGDEALDALEDESRLALLGAAALRRHARQGQEPPSHRFFDLAGALLDARRAADAWLARARLRLLRRLFDDGAQALRRLKREQRVLAFDDLLLQLHEALQASDALAAALRARYPAALVDEFQDTDALQLAILERVWGADAPDSAGNPATLLLVGDPRQAIYGFRGADLHATLRARERADAVHSLVTNQRAQPALVQALDALFGANRRAFLLPGLDHVHAVAGARRRPAFVDRSAAPDPVPALQLWQLPRDADGTPLLREDALRAATRATAAEIARLLREGEAGRITLDGRPLAGGDIAVLVRSHAQAARMRRALEALDVGCVALSPASVFHAPEAEELACVLAAVQTPAHAGRVRAALATPLLGLDAAALAALDDAALLAWMERFDAWRRTWAERGVGAMVHALAQDDAVAPRLLGAAPGLAGAGATAASDGPRRLANLLHLAELLHDAQPRLASPAALLRWLQAQRRTPDAGGEVAQQRLASDQALVRIVTVHKAKGLEYGVVFCPFLWDAQAGPPQPGGLHAARDDRGRTVLDLRAGLDAACDEGALRRQARLEAAAESVRLTYVALTRAVHRCYLPVGAYAVRSGRGRSWQPGCRSLLNWLAAGEGLTPDDWFEQRREPDEVEAAWRRLADGCEGIGLVPLPTAPGERLAVRGVQRVCALAAPRNAPAAWNWVDLDVREQPAPAFDRSANAPLHEMESEGIGVGRQGAGADGDGGGDGFDRALRAALRHADLGDAGTWPAAVAAALRCHPPARLAHEPAQALALQQCLGAVAATEALPGLRLRELPRRRSLRALPFTLPVQDGFVHGTIDLAFEHGGRWWLVAWPQPQAELQWPAQALVRLLRARVAGWRPAHDFGGVLALSIDRLAADGHPGRVVLRHRAVPSLGAADPAPVQQTASAACALPSRRTP